MKKLQIGIDINEANVKTRVGTGQYTFQLLKYFATRPDLSFHLYHRDPLLEDLPPASLNWQYHRLHPSRAWVHFALPLHLALHQAHDVFWSPAHYMPTLTKCPAVVTIHDLAYEYFPDLFLKSDLYKLKHWTRSAVRAAKAIIAVSSATKHDLVNLYDLDPSKISVVHNGYAADVFNLDPKNAPTLLTNWDLKIEQYILFLGTIQPRKNALKLVQAFHLLKQAGYPGKLVLAGQIGWLADETLSVIKHSQYASEIILTGYVSDEQRKTLYTYADVYVLPSLYEGFGVPVLEAMGCGAPVAVSDNSSLPEVVGNAGLTFNASDPSGIADSIMQIKQHRSTWVKRSLARARDFSWEKTAKETLSVILKGAK